MKKYSVGVIGLRMGNAWARSAASNPLTRLAMVYDKNFDNSAGIDQAYYRSATKVATHEDEIYKAGLDVIIVASPDHFHAEQCIKAMRSGSHVICEKPLAQTVKDCKTIIAAVKKYKKMFMTGQVCRYAPGFVLAKELIDEGRIGKIAFIESEYAHDYSKCPGVDNWRKDTKIRREGFIGGGCHAMDLVRWLVGNPEEVFCYTNHELLPDWPTADTGVAICKFKHNIIGKVFVSIGVKRPYTMRTVIIGTAGTIICDNTSSSIQIFEERLSGQTGGSFASVPVNIANHNVAAELDDFVKCLERGEQIATDVYEGTNTVAFGEAALLSAREGRPVKLKEVL